MEMAVGPAAAAPHAADRIDGVWRSNGYGTVRSIEDGRLPQYQVTAVSCMRGDTARRTGQGGSGSVIYTGDDATVYRIRPAVDGAAATLHFDGSVGDRRLLRLPALPAGCAKATPTGALATFDVFWQTFEENYPFFTAKTLLHSKEDRLAGSQGPIPPKGPRRYARHRAFRPSAGDGAAAVRRARGNRRRCHRGLRVEPPWHHDPRPRT